MQKGERFDFAPWLYSRPTSTTTQRLWTMYESTIFDTIDEAVNEGIFIVTNRGDRERKKATSQSKGGGGGKK